MTSVRLPSLSYIRTPLLYSKAQKASTSISCSRPTIDWLRASAWCYRSCYCIVLYPQSTLRVRRHPLHLSARPPRTDYPPLVSCALCCLGKKAKVSTLNLETYFFFVSAHTGLPRYHCFHHASSNKEAKGGRGGDNRQTLRHPGFRRPIASRHRTSFPKVCPQDESSC